MEKKMVPVTCPVCGSKNQFPADTLVEGAILTCPHCKLKITLQCHMWEEIQAEMQKSAIEK